MIAITFCLFAGPLAGPLGGLHAEEVDWKKGKLEHLAPTIGTYRIDEVLGDAAVQAALAALLPPDAMAALTTNLGVVGPVDFIGGHLVLTGNRPHHGDADTAAVWIKIYDGTVRVILQRGGDVTLYAAAERFEYLPVQLRAALATPSGAVPRRAPPDGVTWIR